VSSGVTQALLSAQAGVIVGLAVILSRLRERVAKLEESVRWLEKRLNGPGVGRNR
jgi:hypothetical protein